MWSFVVFCGLSWSSVVFCGLRWSFVLISMWSFVVFCGLLWSIVVKCGLLWSHVVVWMVAGWHLRKRRQKTTKDHERQQKTTKDHIEMTTEDHKRPEWSMWSFVVFCGLFWWVSGHQVVFGGLWT